MLVLWYSDCGMGQHWAQGAFCQGMGKVWCWIGAFGHGRWEKQAPAVLLVLFSPETCPGISQS